MLNLLQSYLISYILSFLSALPSVGDNSCSKQWAIYVGLCEATMAIYVGLCEDMYRGDSMIKCRGFEVIGGSAPRAKLVGSGAQAYFGFCAEVLHNPKMLLVGLAIWLWSQIGVF